MTFNTTDTNGSLSFIDPGVYDTTADGIMLGIDVGATDGTSDGALLGIQREVDTSDSSVDDSVLWLNFCDRLQLVLLVLLFAWNSVQTQMEVQIVHHFLRFCW